MVKPQFEVGKDRVGAGGVVSDPQLRAEAVLAVARRAAALHWHTVAVTASPLARAVRQRRVLPAPAIANRQPAAGSATRAGGGRRCRGGSAMTSDRTILLVVHTGRDDATEVARRVEKVLGDNGIGLRVLSAEAVDRGPAHLAPDDMRALGGRCRGRRSPTNAPRKAASWSWCSAATGHSCVPPNWRAMSRSRCWASIWAASGFSPRPRQTPSTPYSTTSSSATTASRNG